MEVGRGFHTPRDPQPAREGRAHGVLPRRRHPGRRHALLQPEPVRLLDATTLEPAGTRLPGLTTDVTRLRDRTLSLAWSADGSTLAALFHRIRLRRFSEEGFTAWDTTESRLVAWDMTGDPRLLLDEPVPGRGYQRIDRNQLALSPDGNTVWTSQPLSAIDVSTGQVRYRTDRVGYDLALSPDATTLALDDETDVLLLDPATGRLQQTLRGHTENVGSLEFNPKGTRLASTARDRTAIVWNPGTGELLDKLDLGDNTVLGLVYTADGHTLLTGGGDDAVRAWDLTGKRSFLERTRKPGRFGFGWVTPSQDGSYTAHSDIDFGIRFFDTETGRPTSFTGYPCCWGGAFNPTNTRFVGSYGRSLWAWDPRTGRLVADNKDQPWPRDLGDLTYTNDGEHLIVADGGGYLTLIDAETSHP